MKLRTFTEVQESLASGNSVMNILEGYLNAIEENKNLNAFLEVFADNEKAIILYTKHGFIKHQIKQNKRK